MKKNKNRKLVSLVTATLFMFMLCPLVASASPIIRDRQIKNETFFEILFLEEDKEEVEVYLKPNQNYILTYPIHEDGWEITKVKTKSKNIKAKKWDNPEPNKLSIKVKCSKLEKLEIEVQIKNKLTGEKKKLTYVTTTEPIFYDRIIDNPVIDEPWTDEPGTDEPWTDEPGTDEPGTDEPESDEPGTDEPGTDKPGTDKPGTDKPGTDEPGTDEPGTDEPGTDEPGTDEPGTDEPGTDEPGTNEPGTDEPGTDEPGTDEPGTDEPGTDEPSTDEPGTDEPGSDDSHIWGNWSFKDDESEERICSHCGLVETQPHSQPDNLAYVYVSNNDGTHKQEASYSCVTCQQTITVNKEESCDYDVTYQQTGVNDTHLEIKDCTLCQHHLEEEGTCVPTGDLKIVKIYAQIYEYFDCELCGDMCKRAYHTNHQWGEWEYRDSQSHIRYCICVEARETAPHNHVYNKDTLTVSCDECGDHKQVSAHNHGQGTSNNMDLMDLVMSPAYNELVDKGQISNPNPNPGSYCSRYDFICHDCGTYYYVYYDHDFDENGRCKRGYCGHIEKPQPEEEAIAVIDVIEEDTSDDVDTVISDDTNTDSSDDVDTVISDDTNTDSSDDVDTVIPDDADTDSSDDVDTVIPDDANTESSDNVDTVIPDDVDTDSSDNVDTVIPDDVDTDSSDDIDPDSSGNVDTDTSDDVDTVIPDDANTDTSDDVDTDSSGNVDTDTSNDVDTDIPDEVEIVIPDNVDTDIFINF